VNRTMKLLRKTRRFECLLLALGALFRQQRRGLSRRLLHLDRGESHRSPVAARQPGKADVRPTNGRERLSVRTPVFAIRVHSYRCNKTRQAQSC